MARFEESIMLSRDLDIFFINDVEDNKPIHCATFGSIIPEELNDDEYYTQTVTAVSGLPLLYSREELEIEDANVDFILGVNFPEGLMTDDERREAYLRTFLIMASKGFWSYDRFHQPHEQPSDDNQAYILIAHPKLLNKLPNIPLRTCNSLTLRFDIE